MLIFCCNFKNEAISDVIQAFFIFYSSVYLIYLQRAAKCKMKRWLEALVKYLCSSRCNDTLQSSLPRMNKVSISFLRKRLIFFSPRQLPVLQGLRSHRSTTNGCFMLFPKMFDMAEIRATCGLSESWISNNLELLRQF